MSRSEAQTELAAEADDLTAGTQAELPGKLAGLTVRRQVLVLAFWPFLEQLLSFCVGFVDTAIAARLSVTATESIAVGAYVGWLLSLMFGAVGIGAGALVARGIGGRDHRLSRAALGQSLTCALILGVILLLLLWWTAPLLCKLMNLTGESRLFAIRYLRCMGLGTPALGVLFISAACLRSAGDTRTPFFVLACVNVVNITASLLFVYGPAPMGGHGVIGIAVGTAAAWFVGAFIIVVRLTRPISVIRLYLHRLLPHWGLLMRILRISGPQFLDSISLWTGNFLLAALVGYLGRKEQPGALAAHIIVIRIEAISYLPGWAVGQSAGTLVGQYLGLRDSQRATIAARYCWLIGVLVMGVAGAMFVLFADPLVRLVTNEPVLLELAPPLLRVCGPAQIFLATTIVLEHAVRGAGDTRPVAMMVAASTFLVRLPAAYLVGVVWGGGLLGVWVALCCEVVLRASLITAYFLTGRWRRVRV